ncbi:MAG: hypothetical protein WC648_01690 [Candidatus Paceibacterota bacterium]|jgi:hypothetical protein
MKTTQKLVVIAFVAAIAVSLGAALSFKNRADSLERQLAASERRYVALEKLHWPPQLEDTSSSSEAFNRVKGPNVPQMPPAVFQHGIAHDGDDTIITYGNFRGRPLQMVFVENFNRVLIRIDITTTNFEWYKTATDDETLAFLKQEVERLVSTNGPTRLGDSGVLFVFKGKFPVWGPYSTHLGMQKEYRCLYFGDNATLRDCTLEAWGTDSTIGYYPYTIVRAN